MTKITAVVSNDIAFLAKDEHLKALRETDKTAPIWLKDISDAQYITQEDVKLIVGAFITNNK